MNRHQLIARLGKFVSLVGLTLVASCAPKATIPAANNAAATRPNVVVIVADDLGFSDLGAFGGEIETPNLDALATAGLRLTDFHTAPSCSPTRSMLLSGSDNHTAGLGAMAEAPIPNHGWGYEGHLTPRVATLAERMREAGYQTLMAGKWHLGITAEQDPHARGFDRSFALLQGAHNHFGKGGFGPDTNPLVAASYTQNGKPVTIPDDFYSSDYFTTKMIEQLDATDRDRPFLAYLAFTAPHSPLQAPDEVMAKYRGRYDTGWDALRSSRLSRMKALGLLPPNAVAPAFRPNADAWDKLTAEQKRVEARTMEIYAAMVDRLDQNVGRLIAHLRATNRYDNTIFVFSSDNGAAGETGQTFSVIPGQADFLARADNRLENMGKSSSFLFYGPYWAQAATAPSSMFKGWMTEGGTRVPAFITYAGFQRQGVIGRAFSDVMDVLPTLLAATNSPLTNNVAGTQVAAVRGRSMLPYLLARTERVHDDAEPVVMELHGQRSVRQGSWKLVWLARPGTPGAWSLYNLATDRAEQFDLAAREPDRVSALVAAWDRFAAEARIRTAP